MIKKLIIAVLLTACITTPTTASTGIGKALTKHKYGVSIIQPSGWLFINKKEFNSLLETPYLDNELIFSFQKEKNDPEIDNQISPYIDIIAFPKKKKHSRKLLTNIKRLIKYTLEDYPNTSVSIKPRMEQLNGQPVAFAQVSELIHQKDGTVIKTEASHYMLKAKNEIIINITVLLKVPFEGQSKEEFKKSKRQYANDKGVAEAAINSLIFSF